MNVIGIASSSYFTMVLRIGSQCCVIYRKNFRKEDKAQNMNVLWWICKLGTKGRARMVDLTTCLCYMILVAFYNFWIQALRFLDFSWIN